MGISENILTIQARIEAAARRAGRNPDDVLFVAVTKTRPVDAVREVVAQGVHDLGENRVQELLGKYDIIEDAVRWHLIGTLQRNKVAKVVGKVALIHSVDSLGLAKAIGEKATALGIDQDVLLETNVSGEESKQGFTPDELRDQIEQIVAIPGVSVRGLMTMAPFFAEAEETRPVFRKLAGLRNELSAAGYGLEHLSMGMSNDFEVAIEEGATIVRIGTAVFT